jgi:hypothetical protein
MIAKLAVAAALAGSAIGAAVVLADEPPPKASVPVVALPASDTADRRVSPLAAHDVRVVRQFPDAVGGAPWAVRRFTVTGKRTATCFELGRLDGDRFGWIDGYGRFSATAAGRSGYPTSCQNPGEMRKVGANVQRFTTLSFSPGATPLPKEAVTWGTAAPSVRAIHPSGEPPITPGADGLFVRVTAGEAARGMVTGEIEHRDGRRVRFNPQPLRRRGSEGPIAGTEFVAARAPDPAGGEPWGVIGARDERGGVCLTYPDRLVGTQQGFVDRRLGSFWVVAFEVPHGCLDSKHRPTRTDPLRIDTQIGGGEGQDRTGEVERRVLSSRIVFWGRVYKDVVSVTIRTPRDVRTLVPSGPAHAILAVYDGRFPGGEVTATARFKDGREVTRTLYSE